MQHVLRTCKFRKLSRRGNMVGVDVRVDDISNVNLTLTRYTQIHFRFVDGIARGAQTLARSTEEIRNADSRRRMQKLSKNHACLSTRTAFEPNPVSTARPRLFHSGNPSSKRNARYPLAARMDTASSAKTQ